MRKKKTRNIHTFF